MNEYRNQPPGAGAAPNAWVRWHFREAGRSVTPRHEYWSVALAAMKAEMTRDSKMTVERARQIISDALLEWGRQQSDRIARMRVNEANDDDGDAADDTI